MTSITLMAGEIIRSTTLKTDAILMTELVVKAIAEDYLKYLGKAIKHLEKMENEILEDDLFMRVRRPNHFLVE